MCQGLTSREVRPPKRMRGMEFHFIEAPKLRERSGRPATGLERLLYYLGNMGGEKEMAALEAADERVAEMRQLERIFRSNPDLVREYQQREQDRLDYRISLDAREAKGIFKGEIKAFAGLVRDGIITVRDAALRANVTEAEFSTQMAALGY